jgi:hypothetical protein
MLPLRKDRGDAFALVFASLSAAHARARGLFAFRHADLACRRRTFITRVQQKESLFLGRVHLLLRAHF